MASFHLPTEIVGRLEEIMVNYARHFSTLATPQRDAARADQRPNHAGGYTFVLDLWARLDRWLVLGCDGGSYLLALALVEAQAGDVVHAR